MDHPAKTRYEARSQTRSTQKTITTAPARRGAAEPRRPVDG